MRRSQVLFLIYILFLGVFVHPVYGELDTFAETYLASYDSPNLYERSYEHYLSLGIDALRRKDYQQAWEHFQTAHSIDSSRKLPLMYLNLIKRTLENRVEEEVSLPDNVEVEIQKEQTQPYQWESIIEKDSDRIFPEAKSVLPQASPDSVIKEKKELEKAAKDSRQDLKIQKKQKEIKSKIKSKKKGKESEIEKPAWKKTHGVIDLNEELWQHQPDTAVDIELRKEYVFRGQNIKRFLVMNEDFLEIVRVDADQIQVTTHKRGFSFFHIWDETGRWTFFVTGVLPKKKRLLALKGLDYVGEEYLKPFEFSYTNSWSSLYSGTSFDDSHQQNLRFRQWMGLFGETPYGKFDASMNFYKYKDSTERVGQRIGLTDGHIGPFSDFTIRVYDASTEFSSLSLPGRSFRGVLLDAYAFEHNIKYSLFYGKDRAQFLLITPGVFDIKKSYMEGLRVTLFPEGDHQYTLNYARGWGEARPTTMKDKVFSVETNHKFYFFDVYAEQGYDEDSHATFVSLLWDKIKDSTVRLNLRNIEEDYMTIIGRPTGGGEVGGDLRINRHWGDNRMQASLEVYQDRENPNEDDFDGLNYEGDVSFYIPLSDKSSYQVSGRYDYAPQLFSARENLSFNSRYTKAFYRGDKRLFSSFFSSAYQSLRLDESPGSEYDRYSLSCGLSIPIWKRLNCFANYDYSWVQESMSGDWHRPHVFFTGLSYSQKLTNTLSGSVSVKYRNEEQAEGRFSFLSGEDSVRGSVSLMYKPHADLEIFVDGNVRNVWTENLDEPAYNDADVRFGLRSNWTSPFSWNPSGVIKGIIYKDFNGDTFLSIEEPGIPGVRVTVGKTEVLTDSLGKFEVKVRAKKVRVSLDLSSVPAGHIISTPLVKDVTIRNRKTHIVNFGLTVHSGIYGIVFYDKNGNGAPDPTEEVFSKAKIILDEEDVSYSDFEGSYVFDQIDSGEHFLQLDVNSLPLEYLPVIKIKNVINVKEGMTHIFHIPLRKK